jgi:MFS family permease
MRFTKSIRPKIPQRDLIVAFILVLNSIVWYTLTYDKFSSTVKGLQVSATEQLMLFVVYYIGAGCSAILGSIIFPRVRKTGFLMWVLAGAIMTMLLTTIASNNMMINILICLFLGVSIGIGLPSCLAYFADATTVENRGVYGGITWVAIGFGTLILVLFLDTLSMLVGLLALAIWRICGLVTFPFLMGEGSIKQARSVPSFRSILQRREVMLYLIPWIMFSLVNFTEAPMLDRLFGDFRNLVVFIEFALMGLFAIIGGLLADLVGRKRVIITGFVMLGIGYAALSIFSGMQVSWYLYTAFDGIAWGMFAAVFFMTIWGDLGEHYVKEKYYALGGLPFLLAGFLPIIIEPYAEAIEVVTAFSLASFFLFLAVIPLMYAPETLPEKKIKERELKDYIEKARKVKEKQARK